ncbi:hypothetical protein [Desulfonema magnum]|nr:hypothetical protein [Desulfonema magnum]
MQYITTAERIGMQKGEIIGIGKGVLIGQILMARPLPGHSGYSRDELENKTLTELERILAKVEARVK